MHYGKLKEFDQLISNSAASQIKQDAKYSNQYNFPILSQQEQLNEQYMALPFVPFANERPELQKRPTPKFNSGDVLLDT